MACVIRFLDRKTGEIVDTLPPDELEKLKEEMWESLIEICGDGYIKNQQVIEKENDKSKSELSNP